MALEMGDKLRFPDEPRITQINKLRSAKAGSEQSLADLVQGGLQHTWKTGGRGDGEARRPDSILIRSAFMKGSGDVGKIAGRLIRKKGLLLRLTLLLLFDAQCRQSSGGRVRNVRKINDDVGGYAPWVQLVLASTVTTYGTGRNGRDLRARQITEALRVLERKYHLIKLTPDSSGRRSYDNFQILSEAGDEAPYTIPPRPQAVPIPRHFFTNLWVFALTDTEIATYLMLCHRRRKYPRRHEAEGIYVTRAALTDEFGLKPATYRSHKMLHRFRLIDQLPDPDRDFVSGRVTNYAAKYAEGEGSVQPWHYRINDATLRRPALETIHQVLVKPTLEDHLRMGGF